MLSKFIRKDKQFVLNFAAVLGVGLTLVSAIRDTTKACKLTTEDMTTEEKIKKTWKCYIPSGVIATSTILCIIYSDQVTMNEKRSLLNALISVQGNYNKLKNSVDEVCDDQTKEEILKRLKFKKFKTYLANQCISSIEGYTNFYFKKINSNLQIKINGYKELANGDIFTNPASEVSSVVEHSRFIFTI